MKGSTAIAPRSARIRGGALFVEVLKKKEHVGMHRGGRNRGRPDAGRRSRRPAASRGRAARCRGEAKRSARASHAPVAVILVAENLGYIKAVSAMTGQNFDRYVGRAFIGEGLATVVVGFAGGTGVATFAVHIGVVPVTKIYLTLVFVVAAAIALVLGFSPKFSAGIQTIPGLLLGGYRFVLLRLIAVTGARIWGVRKVDFSDNRNLRREPRVSRLRMPRRRW